jgi:fimbrial chaperone protein
MIQTFPTRLYFSLRLLLCFLLIVSSLPVLSAHSGWRVVPIRLEFDQRARSGVITVANDDDDKISFSIVAREWTQDEQGKDQYTETSDIMFFPKSLHIDPHSERVIRAGIKFPALNTEKTYRLFIKQEIPPEERTVTNVAIAIRFGVPLFSKPLEERVNGEILRAEIKSGAIELDLKNHGNAHILAREILLSGKDASGTEILSQKETGGYLLAGSARTFSWPLAEDSCQDIKSLDIQVTSNSTQLNRKIDVDKAMCLTP